MTSIQVNRCIAVAERLAAALEKWLELRYPPQGEPVEAWVGQVGKSVSHQPETREDYDNYPEDEPSSFQTILENLKKSTEAG